jgi:hypothetical protein
LRYDFLKLSNRKIPKVFLGKETLQRTRNTLFTDHQEVSQHEYRNQPRQYKGMQAVETGKSWLTNTLTTAQ